MTTAFRDVDLVNLLEEAIALDASSVERHELALERFFWRTIMDSTGVDEGALERHWTAARERVRVQQDQRQLRDAVRAADEALRDGDLERVRAALGRAAGSEQNGGRERRTRTVATISSETPIQRAYLGRFASREFAGMPQRTLPKLDEYTSGLRGLILVGGGPNVGKTVLGVQLGVDAALADPDVCVVIVSLELDRRELETRELCRAAQMPWTDLMFGSRPAELVDGKPTRTKDELDRLDEAWRTRETWGARTVILDHENFPDPSSEEVVDVVEGLKRTTGATRAIVVFDYLQLITIPDDAQAGLRSELAEDKWRVEMVKRLRDRDEIDAVIVITEARKPSGGSGAAWGSGLEDVMGAARIAYRADMVFTLVPLRESELSELDTVKERYPDACEEDLPETLAVDGLSLLRLRIVKGRDGVRRGAIDVTFYFTQTRFAQGHL